MRILLMSVASFAALSVAPVAAQSYPPGYSGGNGNNYSRVAVPAPWQVRSMIDAAERRGEISDDEASNLREQANDLVRLDRRARRDDDSEARRDLSRRTFALLRALRDAGSGSGPDYDYRGRSSGYPPAYRPGAPGNYDNARPAPGDDDDQSYTPPGSDDAYPAVPQASDPYGPSRRYDPNGAAPENDDSYRAAPPSGNPYRAAPPPNDDPNYGDPNAQGDDMTPADDGIYRPRND
jgi:hypothetical protein